MLRTTAFIVASFFCSLVAGCGAPKVGRIGPPVSLPNGAPRSACERENWHELVPARVTSTAMTAGIWFNTIHVKNQEGLGVFELKEDEPSELEDLWPLMAETQLRRRHQARIQPVEDASRRSGYWALGGLAGLGMGLTVAAATSESSPGTATAFGITGVAVGLVSVVGALVTQPSGPEQLDAEARRKLFILREDDFIAAARGVNRLNGAQRRRCGGKPVPSSEQLAPAKPARPAAPDVAAREPRTTTPSVPAESSAPTES